MTLTGKEILKRMEEGQITIAPFKPENINPNSYDLTLSNKLQVYKEPVLSPKNKNATYDMGIPEDGTVLIPGELYIASVNEFTQAHNLVGVVYGKSSLGRLGLMVHVCAGFVDNGYGGNITLELAVIRPLRIFPNMKIAQIAYNEVVGEVTPYTGKYQGDTTLQTSKSYKDFTSGKA